MIFQEDRPPPHSLLIWRVLNVEDWTQCGSYKLAST